jgi:YggT family protein
MGALRDVACIAIDIARWALIIWIVLSWVVSFGRLTFDHPVRRLYEALSRVVDPILRPIRSVVPPLRIGGAALDLSPLVLFFGLIVLRAVIC